MMMMHVCCTNYSYPVFGHRSSERGSSASDNNIIVTRLDVEFGRNVSAKHSLLRYLHIPFTGIRRAINTKAALQ